MKREPGGSLQFVCSAYRGAEMMRRSGVEKGFSHERKLFEECTVAVMCGDEN